MKLAKTFLTIAVVGFTAAANADLWYTFDTGVAPVNGAGFTGGTFAWNSAYQAAQQTATTGGWTLGSTGPKFEFGWPEQQTIQALANSGSARVGFDMIVSATATFSVGAWANGDWYQLHFAGNSDGTMGWTQDAVYGPNPVGTNYHPTDPDQTFHFDLAFADLGWQPGDQWFQLFFGSNSDAAKPVQFLVDNIHVYQVPEPTSFALAGLGAAVLLIFRRK